MADGCPPYACSIYNSASAPTGSDFVSVVNIGSHQSTKATARAVIPDRDGRRNVIYQSDTIGHISPTATGTIVRIGNGYVHGGNINGETVNGRFINGGYVSSVAQTLPQQNAVTVLPVQSPPSAHTNGTATVNTNSFIRHTEKSRNAGYDQRSSWPASSGQYAASSQYHQGSARLSRDRSFKSGSSSTGDEKGLRGRHLHFVVFLLILCVLIVVGIGLYFIIYYKKDDAN